jgi:oligosaccharide repeat unit polymerase
MRALVGPAAFVLVPIALLGAIEWPGATAVAMTFAATAAVALWLMSIRPSAADATFIFMVLFLVYQVLNPALYVTGFVFEVESLTLNWDLFARGNVFALLGLLTYAGGVWLANRTGRTGPRRETLDPITSARLVPILVGIAFVAWMVMFVRGGMPTDVLTGRPPAGRVRDMSLTAGGFGYLLDAMFAGHLALLIDCFRQPHRSMLSLRTLSLIALLFVLNGFIGSRLLLVAPLLGAMLLRLIVARREPAAPQGARVRFRGFKRLAAVSFALGLFALSILYRDYRTGEIDLGLGDTDVLLYSVSHTFDTAATYYMVVDHTPARTDFWYGRSALAPLLLLIPTSLFPGKYDAIWGDAKFTLLFYGYDQNEAGTVARGFSMLAEAYLNGGVLGICLVLGSFGFLNERLSRHIRARRYTNLFALLYAVYLVYFLPFAFKSGVAGAVSYIDVKLLVLPLALTIARLGELLCRRVARLPATGAVLRLARS